MFKNVILPLTPGFFYLLQMIIFIFLKHTKESGAYSHRAKWSHILFWCIYHLSHIWVFFNSSILFMVPSKAFFIWYSQNRKFQLPCCSLFFSLFFLAGQSVLWQHFLGELLSCGNQAIFKFCRRVIFNFIYLLFVIYLLFSCWLCIQDEVQVFFHGCLLFPLQH